jgi:hypothetical protein
MRHRAPVTPGKGGGADLGHRQGEGGGGDSATGGEAPGPGGGREHLAWLNVGALPGSSGRVALVPTDGGRQRKEVTGWIMLGLERGNKNDMWVPLFWRV